MIAERHLAELEARVIEVESKRAKEEEERETKQEEVKDDGNSWEVNEGVNSDSNTRDKKDVKSDESIAEAKGDKSVDEGTEEMDIAEIDISISTETGPKADKKEFIPRMDYVETFNIGSKDESLEDD